MHQPNKLFDAIFCGRAILFVGAGFSRDAVNFLNEKLPTGMEFASTLMATLGQPLEADDSLVAAATYFVSHVNGGPAKLAEIIGATFRVKQPAQWQSEIAQMPWKRIYTTNYDDVIERSRGALKQSCKPVTPADSHEHFGRSPNLCVHINGYVEKLTSGAIQREIRLDSLSYATFDFQESEWSRILRHDCEAADAVVFIGYGMSDLDLQRIFVADRLRGKATFVAGNRISDRSRAQLELFGVIEATDGSSFASKCKAYHLANISAAPQARQSLPLISFSLWSTEYARQAPNDTDR